MNKLLKLGFTLVLGLAALTGCGDEETANSADYANSSYDHVFHFYANEGKYQHDLGEILVRDVFTYNKEEFGTHVLGAALEEKYPYYAFKNITLKNGTEYSFDKDTLNNILINTEPDVKFGFLWQTYCWHIFINYTPIEYSIKYYGYDEGFEGKNTYSIENQFELPTIDLGAHKTFHGWAVDGTDYYITETPNENLSDLLLYVAFEDNVYKVTYDLPLELTNNNPKTFTYFDDETELIPFADAEDGSYTFDGFYLDNQKITKLDPKVGKDIKIECRFTFKEYTANYYVGGELKTSNKFTAATLKDYVEPELPEKEHYTGKWSDKVTKAKDYEINAMYEADKYTVTIDTNITGYNVNPFETTYGQEKTYQDIADLLSYTDKAFVGLYSDKELTTKIDLTTLIDKTCTVYAKWDTLIRITSKDDWSKVTANPAGNFILTEDISFKAGEIPVIDNFTGTFDGQGHKIQRFTVSNTSSSATFGIFKTNSGTIKNITFEEGTFVAKNANGSDSANIGFLCGVNKGKIENINFVGINTTITTNFWITIADFQDHTGKLYAGLCCGTNEGTIKNCSVDSTTRSVYKTNIGYSRSSGRPYNGFVMHTYVYQGQMAGTNKGTISNVTVNGQMIFNSITLDENYNGTYANYMDGGCRYYNRAGGVAGYNIGNGVITKSISNATIDTTFSLPANAKKEFGTSSVVGGVVGINDADTNSCQTLQTAKLYVAVNGEYELGGIAGRQEVHAKMNACYSECQFAYKNTSGALYIGGLVGKNQATISYCWADVTSIDETGSSTNRGGTIGALFGRTDDTSTVMFSIGSINLANQVTLVSCYDAGYATESANLIKLSVYAPTQDTTIKPIEKDAVSVVTAKANLYSDAADYYFDEAGYTLHNDAFPTIEGLGQQTLD